MKDDASAWFEGYNAGFDAAKEILPVTEDPLYRQLRILQDQLAALRIERLKYLGK